jgi:hypothetical protein
MSTFKSGILESAFIEAIGMGRFHSLHANNDGGEVILKVFVTEIAHGINEVHLVKNEERQ